MDELDKVLQDTDDESDDADNDVADGSDFEDINADDF